MNDKVDVCLLVPEIDEQFDIFLPINKKIGTIIKLLNKAVNELSNGLYPISNNNKLYNVVTRQVYEANILLYNTDIRNGTRLILISEV